MVTKWCTNLDVALERCPIVFSRSPVKFQGHTGQKSNRFWPELGVSGLYLQFEINNGYEMMHISWSSIEEVPYCFSRPSFTFQGHKGQKIAYSDPNWAFTDSYSSFISPMASKWCTKLDLVYKRWSVVFQGHLSNLKVTRDEKWLIFTRIERFRTVTPVWIHQWLWNDAQSLT